MIIISPVHIMVFWCPVYILMIWNPEVLVIWCPVQPLDVLVFSQLCILVFRQLSGMHIVHILVVCVNILEILQTTEILIVLDFLHWEVVIGTHGGLSKLCLVQGFR